MFLDIFDRFLTACEEANRPNQALLDAAKLTKELGIR